MSRTIINCIGPLLVFQLLFYDTFGSIQCDQIPANTLTPSECADSYIDNDIDVPPGYDIDETLDFHTYLKTGVPDPNTPDGNNWYKFWEDQKGTIDIKYCNAIIPIMADLSDSCLCEMQAVCNDICDNDIFKLFVQKTEGHKLLELNDENSIDFDKTGIIPEDCQMVLPQIKQYEKLCGNTKYYHAIQQCANGTPSPNATPNPTASPNTPQPTSTASPIASTSTTSASTDVVAEDTSTSTTTTITRQSDESITSTPEATGSQDTEVSITTTFEPTSISDTESNQPTFAPSVTEQNVDVSTTELIFDPNSIQGSPDPDEYVYDDDDDWWSDDENQERQGAEINNTSFGNTQIKEIIINRNSYDIKISVVLIAVIIVLFVIIVNIIICWKYKKYTNKHQRLDDQHQDERTDGVISEIQLNEEYKICNNNKDKTVTSYVELESDNKNEGEGSMITTTTLF